MVIGKLTVTGRVNVFISMNVSHEWALTTSDLKKKVEEFSFLLLSKHFYKLTFYNASILKKLIFGLDSSICDFRKDLAIPGERSEFYKYIKNK